MDLRTHRDNLLQGLRREDEELLRPSKEEQEGCCGVEVCGRLLAHLDLVDSIHQLERMQFLLSKGQNPKKDVFLLQRCLVGALQVWNYWPKC